MKKTYFIFTFIIILLLCSCNNNSSPSASISTEITATNELMQERPTTTESATPAIASAMPTPTISPESGICTLYDSLPCNLSQLYVIELELDQKKQIALVTHFIDDDGISDVYCDFFTSKELVRQSGSAASPNLAGVFTGTRAKINSIAPAESYQDESGQPVSWKMMKKFIDLRKWYEDTIPRDNWLIMPWEDLALSGPTIDKQLDEFPVSKNEIHVLELRKPESKEKPIIAFTLFCGSDKESYQMCFIDPFSQKTIGYFDLDRWMLVGTENLPGEYEIVFHTNAPDYFKSRQGPFQRFDYDQTTIRTMKDLREFYQKIVPVSQQYIAPENMRGIDENTYVEILTSNGQEKIMFVKHTQENFKVDIVATGKKAKVNRYYSIDLISEEYLYFFDYLDDVLQPEIIVKSEVKALGIKPKKPVKLVLFSKYFKGKKYKNFMTVKELTEFYKANVPENKQLLIPVSTQ